MKFNPLLLSSLLLFSLYSTPSPNPFRTPKAIAQANAQANPAEIKAIVQTLQQYGFQVHFTRPPKSNAYGLMQPKTKQIWVHPITHQLGIAQQTLIHEAVHAAQSCKSTDPVEALGLDIPIAPMTRRHFLRYHDFRRHVEAEALTVQGLPNGSEYVIQLLKKHC